MKKWISGSKFVDKDLAYKMQAGLEKVTGVRMVVRGHDSYWHELGRPIMRMVWAVESLYRISESRIKIADVYVEGFGMDRNQSNKKPSKRKTKRSKES